MESDIAANISRILENIREKASRSGRKATDIRLMAVTKTVDDSRIRDALQAGIKLIGENYVQETARKKASLEQQGSPLEWHMVGRLQTNKAKYAVKLFDMIHSVDSLELARELDKRSKAMGRVTKVLIEANTGGEKTKSGVPLSQAQDLIIAVAALENISVEGLMTIPPWFPDREKARPYFAALRELKEKIEKADIPRVHMRELSMGMTDDYGVAVEEGATIVRIGRGIFGARVAKK
ncbi:MAG TPA: YggS family pyridoxal phosphate-dependent enzyme [Syntrophales bacterium]|nr:YggS family pyridoxal phosphate-dependent enzyme [Syntrophales bacterium]